jgi:glycosyltransferase involved in cell wall biosynthesis
MRILFGTDTYHPDVNGASYFTQRLAAGLIERDHEVRVLCPSHAWRSMPGEHAGVETVTIASVPVPRYPELRFSPPYPRRAARLREALRDFQPDLVHCQNHFFLSRALMRTARRLGVPVVATNHFVPENILVQLSFLPASARRAVGWWLARDLVGVYERADAVVAPTPFAARLLERTGFGREVTPISCGLDLTRFGDRGRAPRRPDWLPRRPTLLFVGRLDREKRIEELLDAVAQLRERVDAQLVVVGRGKERPELERHAAERGVAERVIFTGFVSDEELPGIYAAADVFCMPGTIELQSIVMLEAMAFGKPVIAVDALALPHLARDGVNGYTYAPGDVATLTRRAVELLTDEDLRARMGAESREIVSEHGIERTLDEYELLYARALAVPSEVEVGAAVEGEAELESVGVR